MMAPESTTAEATRATPPEPIQEAESYKEEEGEEKDLKAFYTSYLASFMQGNLPALETYISPSVSRNGKYQGITEYKALSEAISREKGITVSIAKQVIGIGTIAVQLVFRGVPRYTFLGFEATGRAVEVEETIIYEVEGEKIVGVWSSIDRGKVGEQLGYVNSIGEQTL